MAKEITIRVHSEEDYVNAEAASNVLFGKSTTEDLEKIDEETLLSVFEGVPTATISSKEFSECTDITELLSVTTNQIIFQSKGEAKRLIQGGGVSVNKIKVTDPDAKPDFTLLQEKYLVVQKGKKNYFLVKVD